MRIETQEYLYLIEGQICTNTPRSEVLKKLRILAFSDFALLLFSMPNLKYPKISKILPKMASEEIQISWTGTSGLPLLQQTVDFVRTVASGLAEISGSSLQQKKILDFGCGYGRIARLMYYFVEENDLYAVDPWDRSINICHQDGLVQNFLLSDYLPKKLPLAIDKFDLIYAFSVFTHLSERATKTCLYTLLDYLADNGVMVITIRPLEYWNLKNNSTLRNKLEEKKVDHQKLGFAFLPHNTISVDGDITYGDTSISIEWIMKNFPTLRIVKIDYSLSDPYQIYIFLKKI